MDSRTAPLARMPAADVSVGPALSVVWTAAGSDLVTFEIHPVLGSAEAAARVREPAPAP